MGFGKILFYCMFVNILIILYTLTKFVKNSDVHNENFNLVTTKENFKIDDLHNVIEDLLNEEVQKENKSNLKHILQWTSSKRVPFIYMRQGQEVFIEKKCPFTNCFVTDDRNYLDDYRNFDVIAFAGPEVVMMVPDELPESRAPHQKFVFATIESSHYYPICNNYLNGFFNWTWTYKLDSAMRWGYIVVRDSNGKIVGPNKEMHWMRLEDMDPVTDDFKNSLRGKSKAAAWFVSHCVTISERESMVILLREHLALYDLNVDVYGKCSEFKCTDEIECNKMIEKDYYFYLAFENALSEDYVTEKLLHALQHNAVPIVFGGANYTRFMPDGIYLNAMQLSPAEIAKKIHELMQDKDKYAEFFRWKKHYSFHSKRESVETDDYCSMCTLLNNKQQVEKETTYKDMRQWWNPDFIKECEPMILE